MNIFTADNIIKRLKFAFQPIVSFNDNKILAYEALLRGCTETGFDDIGHFFDKMYDCNLLYYTDKKLRQKCVEQFSNIDMKDDIKLFYNIDNRVLNMPDYVPGFTCEMLEKRNFSQKRFCFEISEKHPVTSGISTKKILRHYRNQGYGMAIDDYGAGYSGLKLLYHSEPDFIKIDRFFIENIDKDEKKKMFVTNIVSLAHLMDVKVIAEGIETEEEYKSCQYIECDYAQGFFTGRPQIY